MYRGRTCGVVIPAYNEEGFVGDSIEEVPDFVDRIYVIDDGSTDGTWAEIRATAERVNEATDEPFARAGGSLTPRVVPIQHEQNRGVGGAIKTGYQRARADRIGVTAVMGGDGQMEPEMLGDLFDPIVDGRAEYTKGNRLMDATDHDDMPRFRFVGNVVLTVLTKLASGYWGSGDPQSGYTAISLEALETASIDDMYEYYGYCNDLLVRLNVAGMRVADVPRPITYGEERSHIRYSRYIPRVSAMLFRNFLKRLKLNYLVADFHPAVLAYAVAIPTLLLAMAATLWSIPGVGAALTPIARGFIAVLLWAGGLLSLVAAMALDSRANAHLDATTRGRTTSRTRLDPMTSFRDGQQSTRTAAADGNGGDAASPADGQR